MSKRAGEFITLDELLAEVGVDAARWYFASRAARRQTSTSTSSSRRSSRTRTRSTTSSTPTPGSPRSCARRPTPAWRRRRRWRARSPADPRRALARAIVRLPEVVEDAVAAEETQGITAYATELATAFHAFYRDARVVDPGAPGAVGRAAGPRAVRPRSRSRTPRAAGDLRARRDVARPAESRETVRAGRPAAARRRRWRRRTSGPCRPRRAGAPRCRPAAPTAVVGRICELAGIGGRVPRRLHDQGPGIVRSLEHGQAVAAPAGGRVDGVGPADAHLAQPDAASGTRRTCPGAPGPAGARGPQPRSGSSTATGSSPAGYLSGWRICSVDSGRSSYRASTAAQPPAVWRGRTKA